MTELMEQSFLENRVVALMPTAKDAAVCRSILTVAEIPCLICFDVTQVCYEIVRGAGTLLLTEDCLLREDLDELSEILSAQPKWSDLPVLMLARGAMESPIARQAMQEFGSVVFLEQPVQEISLISALHAALQARQRQYQLREHLAERQRTENALREREERFHGLADNLPSVMIYQLLQNPAHPEERQFIYVSANVEHLHEVSAAAVLADAQVLYGQILPEFLPGLLSVEAHSLLTKSSFRYELQCRLPSGTIRWFELARRPRVLSDGRLVWDGAEVDMTERKEMELALSEAKRLAEQSSQAKSVFLATMSHEIRTPLSAIVGFSELMTQFHPTAGEQSKYAELIRQNGDHLVRLIDDILDFSKIEAGKLQVERVEIDFAEFIADIVSTMGNKAREKMLEFVMVTDVSVPRSCVSDPVRLKQILSNIIGNAIKFTEKGRVCVSVRATVGQLHFLVEDTGIGISNEQARKLFQPFMQADASTTRRFGGSGLGLVLSRRLAQALGGDVVLVANHPGEGCTFEITVSLEGRSGAVGAPLPTL